jgi:hypothetical protein
MALGAISVGWGITGESGLLGAAGGAAAGVVAGELLARSKLRTWFALLLALGGAIALARGASGLRELDEAVRVLGGPRLLSLTSGMRAFSLCFAVTGPLRLLGARASWVALGELALATAALPAAFAAHRDGSLARPLWLSDWAWRNGENPATLLLGAGAAAALVLGLVLLTERTDRRSRLGIFWILGLCLALGLVFQVTGPPPPPPPAGLSLSGSASAAPAPAEPPPGDGGVPPDGGSPDGGESDGGNLARSDVPRPGEDKPRPVAVVVLEADYTPPTAFYYLREDALSQFNGTRLVRATRGDVDRDLALSFPLGPVEIDDPPPEAGRTRIPARIGLLTDHAHPFALEGLARLEPEDNPNPGLFRRVYHAESLSLDGSTKLMGHAAGDRRWAADQRAHYLAGPSDPRYARLATEILAELGPGLRADPFARALAIKLRLDDTSSYSLARRHAGAADETAAFLFGDRIGYCVHFASAAVFLWRAAGVPARVGTGYLSAVSNRGGGSSILLRSSDAHAWPELYLDGVGWVVLDISPHVNLDPPSPPQDEALQQLLGELARGKRPPPLPPAPSLRQPARELLALARRLLPDLAVAALLALAALKLWRRVALHVVPARHLSRVGYRTCLDLLAEAGFSRSHGETREAFARRVAAASPAFTEATARHLSAALGRPGAPLADRARWRSLVRSVRADLARATPLSRRLLGLVDPVAWRRSR